MAAEREKGVTDFQTIRENAQAAVSDRLRQNGVVGVKYLDQGSRYAATSPAWTVHLEEGGPAVVVDLKSQAEADAALKLWRGHNFPQAFLKYHAPVKQTRNFVLFDPSVAKVIRRYGVGGLVAGSAGVPLSGGGGAQDQDSAQ